MGEHMTEKDALVAWMETVSKVLGEVSEERVHQQIKWGEQNHPDGTGPGRRWPALFNRTMAESAHIAQLQVDHEAKQGVCTYGGILLEEVFEAMAESDPAKLRAELLQVAAVAVAWVEKIDRDLSSPPVDDDPWCREESCRYRHWRSGSIPTHRKGSECPAPVTPPGEIRPGGDS